MDTMYPAKINSPATTLASGINDIVTTIPLTDASVVPAAPNLAVIGTGEDAETVLYTGKSGNDLTGCTRGFQGTAKAWDSGTSVARFFTAYDYDTLRTNLAAHDPATTGVHGAGANTLWHGGVTNAVGKTHLSQDFGASSARLLNLIMTPIAGEIMRVQPAASTSPFSGVINGAPTATSVVYDGDTNEGMLEGIASGADYWGRVILHNTTRGNSRKVVEWNVATNTITTESSTDDWADDDVITCQSQTNAQAGYFDVDLSAEIPTTTDAIFIYCTWADEEGNYDANRYVIFHPFEAYDQGKRQWMHCRLTNEATAFTFPMKLISQKITVMFGPGVVNVAFVISVKGEFEYADT